ncbi:MAG TPA: c-type cytochrome [Telluria sp.]|nr:c-type cytochrome [Telluria sp.]
MKMWIACALIGAAGLAQAGEPAWQALGRPATPAEVKAWDIDVRGDFTGLPKGSGSVSQGEQVWESRCASCHGTFGESNEVFTPIVGGTTEEDIKTGHVAALKNGSVPQRTTLMKVARVSTLWDYIHRAMPWNAPKSLSNDEVYAVVAYILNLGGVLPADYVLSDANIAAAQQRLPNRNGLKRQPGLWEVHGKPDVINTACMKDCPTDVKETSSLPAVARNAHGNLAEQNRGIGPVRGADTTKPPPAALVKAAAAQGAAAPQAVADGRSLIAGNGCTACHGVSNKVLGPAFRDVAARYKDRADRAAYLLGKIRSGGSGVWGSIPMPPQAQLNDADAKAIAQWLAAGAP